MVQTVVQAQNKLELGLSFASILSLFFLRVAGWVGCGAYVVGGWVLTLKLMLTQPPTKLELELWLILAKSLHQY